MRADVLVTISMLTNTAALLFAVAVAWRAGRRGQLATMWAWLFTAMWVLASTGADWTLLVMQDTNDKQADTIAIQQDTKRLRDEAQQSEQFRHEIELGEPAPFPDLDPPPKLILL